MPLSFSKLRRLLRHRSRGQPSDDSDSDMLWDPDCPSGILLQPDEETGARAIAVHKDFYGNLDPTKNEIRVLVVKPGKPGAPLVGTLVKAGIGGELHFHALSYTWGDPSNPRYMMLNGHEVPITKNLAKALDDLRQSKGYLVIWVDALCINQKDNVEKSHQVRRMKDIYQSAMDVLIWLGDGSYGVAEAFQWLSELPNTDFSNEASLNQLLNPQVVHELQRILDSPWWRRVWIVQELALARRALVCCGRHTLPFEYFDALAQAQMRFLRSGASVNLTLNFMLSPLDSQDLVMLCDIRNRFRDQGPYNLAELIQATFFRIQATDPRDRFYGLLGLTTKKDREGLDPDYTIGKDDLLVKGTVHLIKSTHSFNVLQLGEQLRQSKDSPSWLPGWDQGTKVDKPRPWIEGNAAQGLPFHLDLLNSHEIVVSGLDIAKVVSVSKFQADAGTKDEWSTLCPTCVKDWHKHLEAMKGLLPDPYKSQSSMDAAFSRTLTGGIPVRESDVKPTENIGQQSKPYDTERLVDAMRAWLGLTPGSELQRFEIPGGGFVEAGGSDFSLSLISPFRGQALRHVRCRSFVILSNGCIGLGHDDVCEGDVAVLVGGSSAPIFLRPYNGVYKWIGAVYIDGYMNGSWLNPLQRLGYWVSKYRIC
ncbi:heterokaryon incompatibility protein-domain-containing protein [Thelonectria olida]|uniref:Heterokaryon incompatibility protein-domain-containing protein n=1 Tax=Thelonectria olida TaxID=1576542 RepID=A0A9P8WBE2_9HYPO|nr:heterokaryon incompatibility protein-domain-containing protein [Thelonectria olida]